VQAPPAVGRLCYLLRAERSGDASPSCEAGPPRSARDSAQTADVTIAPVLRRNVARTGAGQDQHPQITTRFAPAWHDGMLHHWQSQVQLYPKPPLVTGTRFAGPPVTGPRRLLAAYESGSHPTARFIGYNCFL
jgi:hypothetical protein